MNSAIRKHVQDAYESGNPVIAGLACVVEYLLAQNEGPTELQRALTWLRKQGYINGSIAGESPTGEGIADLIVEHLHAAAAQPSDTVAKEQK